MMSPLLQKPKKRLEDRQQIQGRGALGLAKLLREIVILALALNSTFVNLWRQEDG